MNNTQLARILARHQLGDILPHGVLCMCGAELAALNAPLDDAAVKGEPLARSISCRKSKRRLRKTMRIVMQKTVWTAAGLTWTCLGCGPTPISPAARTGRRVTRK